MTPSSNHPMTYSEYVAEAKALRGSPMVAAWIKEYQRNAWAVYQDCKQCGFPHSPHILCNGATFGEVVFGAQRYSIELGNVVWWEDFMRTHSPNGAFHWRDQKYFRRTEAGVEIIFFTKFNNTPQRNVWVIPSREWESIIKAVR